MKAFSRLSIIYNMLLRQLRNALGESKAPEQLQRLSQVIRKVLSRVFEGTCCNTQIMLSRSEKDKKLFWNICRLQMSNSGWLRELVRAGDLFKC